MKNKIAAITFFIIALLIAVYFLYNAKNNRLGPGDKTEIPQSTAAREVVSEDKKEITGTEKSFPLVDVTNGVTFSGGITTQGQGLGILEVSTDEKQTMLRAVFEKLPTLPQGYYYEGWLMSSEDPENNMSTGEVVLDDKGNYVNDFVSSEDLKNFDKYVLTLEPQEEHLGPAIHLLEGDISWQN